MIRVNLPEQMPLSISDRIGRPNLAAHWTCETFSPKFLAGIATVFLYQLFLYIIKKNGQMVRCNRLQGSILQSLPNASVVFCRAHGRRTDHLRIGFFKSPRKEEVGGHVSPITG